MPKGYAVNEPWIVLQLPTSLRIVDARRNVVMGLEGSTYTSGDLATFQRVARCVTACQGISDDQLDRALRSDLPGAPLDPFFAGFAAFRRGMREILHEHGVSTTPAWSDDDIVAAIRHLAAGTGDDVPRRHQGDSSTGSTP